MSETCSSDSWERRSLRVLFVTAWYPSPQNPFSGVFVREHARAVNHHNDVVVLHCAGDLHPTRRLWQIVPELDAELSAGIPTFRVTHRRIISRKASYPLKVASVATAMSTGTPRSFSPDIIHAHVYEAGVVPVLLKPFNRRPVVITEHWTGFPRRQLGISQVVQSRFAFRGADRILPVSSSLEAAIRDYGIDGSFELVPNAVDESVFHPSRNRRPSGPKRLLFVGLFERSHQKGIPTLLRALERLRRRRVDWKIDIVGDGPPRSEYEALARALDLDGHAIFRGTRSKGEIAGLMCDSDLFVLSSRWENLPCVLLEALATGLPVVATTVGGVPDVVNAENGVLVVPGDDDALASAIDVALDSLRGFDKAAISANALQRFGLNSVGLQLDDIYRRTLRAHAAQRQS